MPQTRSKIATAYPAVHPALIRWRCRHHEHRGRRFVAVKDCAVVKCGHCETYFYVCDQCGGLEAAQRALFAHQRYYAQGRDGHPATGARLKVLQGGRPWHK